MNPVLESLGGAIPAARLADVIAKHDPYIPDGTIARRVYKVRNEVMFVSFDFADRLLVDLELQHEWHHDLADLYERMDTVPLQRGGVPALIRGDALRAAYTLYEQGMSTIGLSELLWEQFGYASAKQCRIALSRHLRKIGRLRSFTEAGLVRWRATGCVGCGTEMDKRTKGCNSCSKRHNARKHKGLDHVAAVHACAGCGCSYDQRTRGCHTCLVRQKTRQQRERRALATAASRPRVAGLGGRGEGTTLLEEAA